MHPMLPRLLFLTCSTGEGFLSGVLSMFSWKVQTGGRISGLQPLSWLVPKSESSFVFIVVLKDSPPPCDPNAQVIQSSRSKPSKAGFFQEERGQTTCAQECQAGAYSSEGARNCTLCPVGTSTSGQAGQGSCAGDEDKSIIFFSQC